MTSIWMRGAYLLLTALVFPGLAALSVLYGFRRMHRPQECHVPVLFYGAAVAIEDKRFLLHYGVDWLVVVWSMLHGARKGRSTLTQQLVKNILYIPDVVCYRRSWPRKIVEAVAAVLLESRYSKDEIMGMYYANVRWGQFVGLDSAALAYFRKSPEFLDVREVVALVTALQGPVALMKNPARWAQRQYMMYAKLGVQQEALTPEVPL